MTDDNIRVLLVDDHKVLRDGLRLLLTADNGIDVIGEAEDGNQAMRKVKILSPDVVVMDLGLPDISGIEVTKQILESQPEIRIVILSMHASKEFVIKAMSSGASGYVPKSSTHESLLDAIRSVHKGERYLHPLAANALLETYIEIEDTNEQRFQELTGREQEVFRLSAMGFTSKEIGDRLIISPKTVDTYRQRAFEKLGVDHRSEMIHLAFNLGILNDLKD